MKTLKLLLIVLMFLPGITLAGGGVEPIDITLSKTSATANGSDSIKVTVRFFRYKCALNKLPDYGGGMATIVTYSLTEAQTMCKMYTGSNSVSGKITVDGSLAITDPKLQLSVAGTLKNPDNANYVDTGYAYFTIKSTTAGSKTLIAKSAGASAVTWAGHDTKVVTLKTLTATTPLTSGTDSTNTTNETEKKAETNKKPSAPTLERIESNGELKTYQRENQEQNSYQYEYGKEVKFAGKTIKNGKVNLYFYSEEFTDSATADAEGNWEYVLTEDIGEGEHELKMTVTDPGTKLTSEISEPINFSLIKVASESTLVEEKNDLTIWYFAGGAFLLLVIGVGTLLFMKRKKHKLTTPTNTEV